MISMTQSVERGSVGSSVDGDLAAALARMAKAAVIAACIGSPASVLAQAPADEVSQAQGADRLEEVVVTASKRAESLQSVPTAITALTGDAIEQQGFAQFADYAAAVPGLGQVANGAAGHGQVILRGLTTGILQNSPTVAFLIDDVTFTANQGLGFGGTLTPDPDLADVERIEVLKGPQGTLYGASALGGIVKIVSRKPDAGAFSADARASYSSAAHGGDGYGVRGTLNIPLVSDKAAVRITAFKRIDPGYMKNVARGLDETNETEVTGGKIALAVQLTPDLDIQLSGLIQDLQADGGTGVDYDSSAGREAYCRYCYAAALGQVFETKYRLGALSVNWSTSVGTLTNSLSYGQYRDPGVIDLSDSIGILNVLLPQLDPSLPPAPTDAATLSYSEPFVKKLTEELRFATSRLGNFEALGGLFYTREESEFDSSLVNRLPPALTLAGPPWGNLNTGHSETLYEEYSAFGNVTYYFTDSVDLTVGARFTHNKQEAITSTSGIFAVQPPTSFDSTEDPITYLATLRYRPMDQLDTYVRVATGYRPGGPQVAAAPDAPPTFKRDTTTNYEVGAKGRWLDGRLMTNVAVYYIDWQDMQISGFNRGFQFFDNGGDATSKGVELELAYLPMRGLTIQLTSSYNRSKMAEVTDDAAANTGIQVGDSLPYAPEVTASAAADYEFPVGSIMQGSCGFTYAYQGSRHTNWSENVISPDVVLPAYATLALRAGIEWDQYSVQVRASNLTDEYEYATNNANNIFPGQGALALRYVIPPRTYAVDFSVKF
jgi:iron complex outermembrane recepter protein